MLVLCAQRDPAWRSGVSDTDRWLLLSPTASATTAAGALSWQLRMGLGATIGRLGPHFRQLQHECAWWLCVRSAGVSGRGL